LRHLPWVPATLLTAVLCASSAPAHASLADYLAARKQFPPRAGLSYSTVSASPDRYRNAVLELRGIVSGVSRYEEGSNVLLRLADGRNAMVEGSADADLPVSGAYARALVTVEAGGVLRLIALATESEIGDRDLDPKPAAPAQPKPGAKLAKMPVRWPVAQHGRSSVSSRAGGLVDPRIKELYKQFVKSFNPKLSEAQASLIAGSIVESSYERGVDARFIMAVFATESGFKIKARSRAGAMGIGQLMPGTARDLGVSNAYDPEQNIQGAVKLIQRHWTTYSQQTSDFGKFISLVCAAYNAGPGAVKKYGGVPPYRETQDYIRKVAAWYSVFAPELFVK